MVQTNNYLNRKICLGIMAVLSAVILACNIPIPGQVEQVLQKKVTMSADKNSVNTALPVDLKPLDTELLDELPTQLPKPKAPTKKQPPALPTVAQAGSVSLYESGYHGVAYSVAYPGDFTHKSSNGWELFCLESDSSLCVTIHPRNGNWGDAKGLANEVMEEVREKTSNMIIYDQRSIMTAADGFPAYRMDSTYTYKDTGYDSMNIFIVIQHVGFEIAADGEARKLAAYHKILEGIMNSFKLEYN